MRSSALALALLLGVGGCNNDKDGDGEPGDPVPTTSVTTGSTEPYADCDLLWERDVVGFFDNWCAPCHSASIPEEWRQGAPVGVDLDSLDAVRIWAERVRATALVDEPTMPPAGGTSLDERALVEAWIDCGMPGTEEVEVDPCEGAPAVPVALDDDLSGLCAAGEPLVVDGDVVVAEALSLDCACEITGSVWLEAPLQAATLRSIGGSLSVSAAGSVEAPELSDVGGDLSIASMTVPNLYLDDLSAVGGQLWVHDTEALERLSLQWLRSLGGPLVVSDAEALARIEWPRLATVVGDVRFERLPSLTTLEPLVSVEHVTGELVVLDTAVRLMGDLRGYERIDGGIRVEGNSELVAIDGFWHLTELSSLVVVDNPALQGITGFDLLEHVDIVELRDNPSLTDLELPLLSSMGTLGALDQGLLVSDAEALSTVTLPELQVLSGLYLARTGLVDLSGFSSVRTIGPVTLLDNDALLTVAEPSRSRQIGGLRVEGNEALEQLTAFATTTTSLGDVRIDDQPALHTLDLSELAEIDGTFALVELPVLSDVDSLGLLTTVSGDLQLQGLQLVDSVVALHGLTEVGGDVVVRDNPVLPSADVAALVQAIDTIGGSVDVGDNGP